MPFFPGRILYINKDAKSYTEEWWCWGRVRRSDRDRRGGGDGSRTHHAINLIEARNHVQRLDEALQMMEAKIEGGKIKDVLKDTIQEFIQRDHLHGYAIHD